MFCILQPVRGAHWLSSLLDLRLKGWWLESYQRHSVVFLSKTLNPLLSTGSTKEDRKMSRLDLKSVDWDIKHLNKQIDEQ